MLKLLDFLWKRAPASSASLAKERLQVIIASEGHGSASAELVQQIRQAVMEAISRFVDVSPDTVSVERRHENDLDMLSVSVSLPADLSSGKGAGASGRAAALR